MLDTKKNSWPLPHPPFWWRGLYRPGVIPVRRSSKRCNPVSVSVLSASTDLFVRRCRGRSPSTRRLFSESSLYPSPSLSLGYPVGTNRQRGESPRAAPGHPLGDGCLACLPQASCFRRLTPGIASGISRTWAMPFFVVGHHCPSGMTGSSGPYRWWTSPPTNAARKDPPGLRAIHGPGQPSATAHCTQHFCDSVA